MPVNPYGRDYSYVQVADVHPEGGGEAPPP
jgi:hypothetical protein